MKYAILFTLCILCASCGSLNTAAQNATPEKQPFVTLHRSQILDIKNNFYSISFFPGHMFPFQIKNAQGTPIPEFIWFDRVVADNTKQFFLRIDRFAERKIISQSDDHIIIEITANYCLNEEITAPGNIRATYRYECSANSPKINITATVMKDDDMTWTELHILQPSWRGNPWNTWTDNTGKTHLFKKAPSHLFTSPEQASISNDTFKVTIEHDTVFGWNNASNKYYSYISAAKRTKWNAKSETFKATLAFQ